MPISVTFTKTSKRLLIRFYNANDYELWKTTHEQMPEARNQWDLKPDPEFEASRAAFKKMLRLEEKNRKTERYYFIALDKKTGQPIGHAILYDIRRHIFQSGGIGYGIYNSYWGQGYGRELVEAMLQIGFSSLKLHRIEACIEQKNRRSLKLAQSLNMVREGIRRGFVYTGGSWKTLVVYSLLSDDLKIAFKFPAKSPK